VKPDCLKKEGEKGNRPEDGTNIKEKKGPRRFASVPENSIREREKEGEKRKRRSTGEEELRSASASRCAFDEKKEKNEKPPDLILEGET